MCMAIRGPGRAGPGQAGEVSAGSLKQLVGLGDQEGMKQVRMGRWGVFVLPFQFQWSVPAENIPFQPKS